MRNEKCRHSPRRLSILTKEARIKWLRRSRVSAAFYTLLVTIPVGLTGCAGFWDDVFSRDFSFKTYFSKPPDPLVVLHDSTDGDKRARALRRLEEPKEHGGTDLEQDTVVEILVTAATREKQPLCRLAAIETLGKFKDPRAAKGLVDAFYNASAFSAETATIIRCNAVTALGKTRNPMGVELLARVVREPPAEGTELEKQQTLDVRIAAAAALGSFTHYQATEALVYVLGHEKDVALRDRAHESLVTATGQKLPPDPEAWANYLHQANPPHAPSSQENQVKLAEWQH
jgi:HEAT repeats